MKMFRRIPAMLLVFLILLGGCAAPAETTPTTGSVTEPDIIETTQIQETTVPTEPTEPEIDPNLNGLRQALVGTPQVFAVAYLGYHETIDSDAPVDPQGAMLETAPQLCADLPFLLEIPQERVIGRSGDLFCIIPADPDATVTVAKGIWDDASGECRYEDVVYIGTGEPILLLCNNSGWEPDTCVTVSGADGEAVWYPMIDGNHCPAALQNEKGEDLIYDFTPYRDILRNRYQQMKSEWVMPTEELLVGTTWVWSGWYSDGKEVSYLVSFQEDTLYVRWNDGSSRMDQEYWDAPWQLNVEKDYAVLSIDMGEFGVMCYDLLYHPDYAELYLGMDVVWEPANIGLEPTYRFLSAAMMPETLELEGSWELVWTEVEGDRQEAEPGQDTFTIYMTDSGLYHCDHVDNAVPSHSFNDKEIVVFPFAMYEGCENQLWVAAVNYMLSDGTGYDMTLIYGDLLQVLVTWQEDGRVGSARCYYRRCYD